MTNIYRKLTVFLCSAILCLFFNHQAFSQAGMEEITVPKDSILKTMFKYNFPRCYTEANFPEKFLEKKTKNYKVPEEEVMAAFIDVSRLSNCKFGIVFCSKGLYLSNADPCSTPGPRFITYTLLKNNDISKRDKNEIGIGFSGIDIQGLKEDEKNKVEAMLKEIKGKYIK